MGAIAAAFYSAFRDFVTDGVPATGPYNPDKAAIRALGATVEAALGTLSLGSVTVTKATRTLLNGDLAYGANTVALVYADSTDANNDLYVKVGATGTGSWTLTNILHTAIAGVIASTATAAVAAEVTSQVTPQVSAAAGSASAASSSASAAAGSASAASTSASAASTSAAAITAILPSLSGGRQNVFPDPFFTNYGRWEKMGSGALPYAVSNWTIEPPRSTSPYQDGKQARAAGNAGNAGISHYLPNLGLAAGDQFQYAWSAARASGSTANGTVFATYVFLAIDGSVIGSSATLFTSVTGNLLDTTSKSFLSSTITVPAGAYNFVAILSNFAAVNVFVDAIWMHRASVPASPSDNAAIPNGVARVAALEDSSPALNANNVLLKRVTYAARTLALAGASGTMLFSNNTGFAQSLLTSGAPAGGFNAAELPIAWTVASTAPSRFYADVRTLDASASKHPVNGRLVARGWIDVDPTSGGGDTYTILLRDPTTGAVKSVVPADLDNRYCIAVYGVKADGTACSQLYESVGGGTIPNLDSTYPLSYNALPNGGGSSTGAVVFGVNHLLLTSPAETWKTPSVEFANGVVDASDGRPVLGALPAKVFCVVGREARVYWHQVQRRDPRDVNFSVAGLTAASVYEEGIRYVPASAGTVTATISSALGNNQVDSKSVAFLSAAASAASGNRACLFIGDSLIGNGAMLTALAAIAASGGVTALTFLGTQGTTYKNEGYSGTSLGSFFNATLAGGATNPFYSGSTFSFATWKANSTVAAQLTAAGKAEPDYVFIEAGKVDVGSATSDGAALALATGYASSAEAIVQNILANTTATKVVVYTAEPGPTPTGENITYGPLWRVRRNWTILAQAQIAQFSGREAARIYVAATGCAVDPLTGWPRQYLPRSAAIVRDLVTFSTYASMVLTQPAGTIAYATDVAGYFVKVGPSGSGYWRSAQDIDGFAWRSTDSIHYANGAIQVAEANWALIKNLG